MYQAQPSLVRSFVTGFGPAALIVQADVSNSLWVVPPVCLSVCRYHTGGTISLIWIKCPKEIQTMVVFQF
jgi:hypothetical protein